MEWKKELDEKVKIDLIRFKPKNILDRLPNMYEMADKNRRDKNYEDAYVFCKRWLMAANWLQKKGPWNAESKKLFSPAKVCFNFYFFFIIINLSKD